MSSIVETPLAEENLGLVHLCANRFRNRGIEYDDLYGAGCIGLVKAAKAFTRPWCEILHLCSASDIRGDKKAFP